MKKMGTRRRGVLTFTQSILIIGNSFVEYARMVNSIVIPVRDIFVPSSQVKAQFSGLQRGGRISAFVQNVTEEGAELLMDGKQVFAKTEVPLQAGQFLQLEVADIQKNSVVMRLAQTPDALSMELLPYAGQPVTDAARLAQNLTRLLSADIKSSLLQQLTELFTQIQKLPQGDLQTLLNMPPNMAQQIQTQTANQSALAQALSEFISHIALTDGPASGILEKLSVLFTQYNDAQTRSLILKTFLFLHQQTQSSGQSASAPQTLNTYLIGLQIHNSLAHLTQASPFFFIIPVVIQNALYTLKVYYYKEKQPRGKSPREKNHIVLFIDTPNLGVIKIHLWTHLKKLSVIISSTATKIKTFLSPHLENLQTALEHLGFAIEHLEVLVDKKLGDTFSLSGSINKQLSLKSVNVRA